MRKDFGRKFFFKTICFFILSLLITPSALATKVMIDPGHGGTDRGATRGPLTESLITLSVAKILREEISKNKKFTALLTRETDTHLSLEQRADLTNRQNADLFISIHVNSSPDGAARGKEIYFQNQLDADKESLFLANLENGHDFEEKTEDDKTLSLPIGPSSDVKAILEDLKRNHSFKLSALLAEELHRFWEGEVVARKQAIRQAPFFVISNVKCPAALVEIGFLSNPAEAKKLAEPEYQRKIAQGILHAIVKFKEVVDNPSTQQLH